MIDIHSVFVKENVTHMQHKGYRQVYLWNTYFAMFVIGSLYIHMKVDKIKYSNTIDNIYTCHNSQAPCSQRFKDQDQDQDQI
jgi:hypothetical protein